jgi:molybdopterin/thiamine biosynthesis adenylyltransferase
VFDYGEMTDRNIGFVTPDEQRALRRGRVFICGVGGMGGAAAMALARAGVGSFTIADFDVFETSNLNRQVFAFDDTLGAEKTAVTRRRLLAINPELCITTHGRDWPSRLDEILAECKVVINGMDDVVAGIQLYRKAREYGATVIDAYTAPLPSVTVVRPGDPRPEERLGYPTVGVPVGGITTATRDECVRRDIEYVLVHSSSAEHVDLAVASEVITGRRSRMSFAPMVLTTGCLMAFEAVALLVGRETRTDYRGWFFNPRGASVERPRPLAAAWMRRRIVRRFLSRTLVPHV